MRVPFIFGMPSPATYAVLTEDTTMSTSWKLLLATSRPGREYLEYATQHPASCIVSSIAQPGVVAIGTWKNTVELVSQSDGTFRHLCKLTGHKGGITAMAFSMDGMRLYTGARKDNEIICWDLRVRVLRRFHHFY
uniref:WD repeat-containing protein 79 n=1 Tax=Photinus pyralis TaxID=7054 RepID=A0A1Y1K095_PHOPY